MKAIPNISATIIFALVLSSITDVFAQSMPINVGHAVRSNVTSQGVAVSGNYLYVADYRDGLSIYDITSITNPILVGNTTTNYGGYARRVVVSGNYAYVANDVDGLRIYDISSPTNPVCVGHMNDLYNADGSPAFNGADAWDIVISGNYAYLANGGDGLRIYDISNPTAPAHAGHKNFNNNGQYACGIAISGSFAFLADYAGLSTYVILDPANPQYVGTTNCNLNGGYAFSVTISGHYAYVANEGDGMRIFDLSNPLMPVDVGHINNGGTSNGTVAASYVAVSGKYAYLANNTDGVRVYDVSDPANPVNVAVATNVFGAYSKHVAISGNYAFVANSFDGVRIDFLGNPPSPLFSVKSTSTNTVVLSWPTLNAFFEVQQNSDLETTNWVTVTNASVIVGVQNQVVIPKPIGNQFYRLKSL